MYASKKRFLERLTPRMPAMKFGKTIDGTSPPSVFVGRMGYPKVFVGPLVTELKGDTFEMDTPEAWIGKSKMNIVNFRMQLARGMEQVKITEVDNKTVEKMREIALASGTVDANAEFAKQPRGYSFNEDHQPFGPSAPLKSMEISNVRWDHQMEKAHSDTDMKAGMAMAELYEKGVLVSQIQKALSVGAFGVKRKLVPTRWSITAVDDTLGKNLLDSVRNYPVLDRYLVYEFAALENYFVILLMPTQWQYEFLEVFLGVMGQQEMIFTDWEPFGGRTKYAGMGGCYYSVRLAVAEKLEEMKKQAGAIVFRESYPSYTPLGVWLCRESARRSLRAQAKEFNDMNSALSYIANKVQMPFWKYRKSSVLMKQSRLSNFC